MIGVRKPPQTTFYIIIKIGLGRIGVWKPHFLYYNYKDRAGGG